MAFTTNTTAFNPDVNELFEEAFERCGRELRTGYDFRTARRTLNFLITEWANRGINLWTIEQGQIPLVQGQYVYDLPLDTVDLIEHVIRTNPGQISNQTDINISRISVSTYSTIPNKLTQGRPVQYVVDRQITPVLYLWPMPDQNYNLIVDRLVRMDDAGAGANTLQVPFRFYPCLAAGLAYYIAMKKAPDRVQLLKAVYEEEFDRAMSEDRDRAALSLTPVRDYYRVV